MIRIVPFLYQFVAIFLIIVIVVQLLKKRGLFAADYQPVFDRLVTELALPAVIFSSVASISFRVEWMVHAGILFVALFLSGLVAYLGCRILKLPRKTTGALILVSAFGSTATLAAPLIQAVYGAQSTALAEGLVDGTIGVALPFFTIGVLIAVYFGRDEVSPSERIHVTMRNFLTTPIFIAFLLGLALSIVGATLAVPGAGIFVDIFQGFFEVIQQSLQLLVWIAIGLLLRPVAPRVFVPLIAFGAGIKLLVQPAFALAGTYIIGLPVLSQHILIIEAAMPSGAIAAVLADRYGCDGQLASWLVIATYLISLVSIPLLISLAG